MTDMALAAAFFLELCIVLVACRCIGWLGAKVGQPQVVCEMVAGFLLGPSLFGWLAPDLHVQVFPPATRQVLYVASQLGLVLYMFCVGLDFRVDMLVANARRAAALSLAGIAVPFALGGALALMLLRSDGFFSPQVQPFHAVLFVGASMSITAFPMLARIIYERQLTGTQMGTLALAAGAFDDAAAWIVLAVVVGSFSGDASLAVKAAVGGIAYAAVIFGVARPALARVSALTERQGAIPPWAFATILAGLALGAWFTDLVGIYAVFGAFVFGVGVPRGPLSIELQRAVTPVTSYLLLPLFFVYSGLNSQLTLINSAWLWSVAGLVFVAACLGKGGACWIAARVTGASARDAFGVAVLMNARGLMELILLNIGLQRGLITPTLFVILVLMAIGTTMAAGPLFDASVRRRETAAPQLQPEPTL